MAKSVDTNTGWTNTFQMLADEFAEIYGERPSASPTAPDLRGAQTHFGRQTPKSSPFKLARLYSDFHAAPAFPRSALCLSGGGIRSAAFGLGVIQYLARTDLLPRFEYLSTVSGGGYIGSWLSAWLTRAGADAHRKPYASVRQQLAGRETPELEAEEIQRLRQNSNYLTPKLGLFSADTWTLFAIWLRNLLVNWVLLVPLICAAAVTPQLVSALAGAAKDPAWAVCIQYAGIGCYFVSLTALNACRPRWQAFTFRRFTFLVFSLLPLLLSAELWAISMAHKSAVPECWQRLLPAIVTSHLRGAVPNYIILAVIIYFSALVFAWIVNKFWSRPFVYAEKPELNTGSLTYRFRRSRGTFRGARVDVFAEDHQAVAGKHYKAVDPTPIEFRAGKDEAESKLRVELIDGSDESRAEGLDLFIKFRNPINLRIGRVFGWARARDSFAFCLSGACFGLFIAIGHLLFRPWLDVSPTGPSVGGFLVKVAGEDMTFAWRHLAWTTLAVPWLLLSHALATVIFVAITSWSERSDEEREWFGRATGWFLVAAVAWAIVAGLVLLLPLAAKELLPSVLPDGLNSKKLAAALLSAVGGVSGIFTAIVGGGAKTPALAALKQSGWRGRVLYIGAPVFICSLLVGLSLAVDWIAFGEVFAGEIAKVPAESFLYISGQLFLFGIAPAIAAVLLGLVVNINRFSLHEMYRNRLVRAFLGASNTRNFETDKFTFFNFTDNLPMSRLWQRRFKGGGAKSTGKATVKDEEWRPFHVINIALNLVDTDKLAWQERKAESFTMSPLWCGSAQLDAYRRASEYGGKKGPITLGTAMAISGAAVSPNMGYNSSPLVTFLLTLFNVRLGWWLGNPKFNRFAEEGPRISAWTLLRELFGLTNDSQKYVYLSDGGHFDNLGLYEMVRRRCHVIIVSDAGHDPDPKFGDLSNALRKISIDLGIRIDFPGLNQLRPRNTALAEPDKGGPCYILGRILYSEVDKPAPDSKQTVKDGIILYLKPGFRGDEPADIIGYAATSKDFPHETTMDQWFSESQFESYRGLGFAIMQRAHKAMRAAPKSSCSERQPGEAPPTMALYDNLRALEKVEREKVEREKLKKTPAA